MKPIDQSSIRVQNLLRIWRVLVANESVTRGQIASETGLSLMSVTNLVDQFRHSDAICVVEGERCRRNRAGRTAEKLFVNADSGGWLILDLTNAYFRYTLLRLNRAVASESASWRRREGEDTRQSLVRFAKDAAREAGDSFRAVAVVAPGPYDAGTDTVFNKRLPELDGLRLKETLRAAFGNKAMYVDEDVKFAARAYAERYAADDGVMHYVYIGEGVGGAITYNGRIVRGLNAVAGDVGQIATADGTFEEKACLRAFAASVLREDIAGKDEGEILSLLSDAQKTSPGKYSAALSEKAALTASVLSEVAWLSDPHVVVLDCPYALDMADDFVSATRDALADRLRGRLDRLPDVRGLPGGVRAIYLGAAQTLERGWIASME